MTEGALNVSRETKERLEHYVALLKKWNPAINLVAKSTLDDAWERHIVDSIQVYDHAPEGGTVWLDIGSGGGFPGLVCAVLDQTRNFILIESDQRKCAFLNTVSRELDLNTTVLPKRIEAAEPQNADIISARALASLDTLLAYCDTHLAEGGHALFLKGKNYQEEVNAALENWRFIYDEYPSRTEGGATLLKIGEISRG